jgi:hypothetical protein
VTFLPAHGIGGREDLPLPFWWAVAGAAAAVLLSFLALGLLWRTPHLNGATAGRLLPARLARALDSATARSLTAVLAGLLGGYTLLALFFGPDDATNPMPWLLYVYLWVGLVPVSVLLGPVWRRLNPIRAAHAVLTRAARLDPADGLRPLPPGLGYWPAAAGLLAFTWLELVHPDNATLPVLRVVVGGYALVQLLAALIYGSAWFDLGDAVEAYSGLFGRLAPIGRRDDGRLVIRTPPSGLDALPAAPGLPATVLVLLGSTAFDGLSGSVRWVAYVQSSAVPRMLLGTIGLFGTIGLLAVLYVAGTRFAGWLAGVGGAGMPTAFAHSLVPVALGYLVAHYYSLLVLEGQRGLRRLGDPLGTGGDWFGLAGRQPGTALLTPSLVAGIQLGAVVTGHVLGVLLAHDRAVRLFPRRTAVLGQLPLLALMIALTCTGLILLFAA